MIQPSSVHETLSRFQLADGYSIVLDMERSEGSWIHDAVTGTRFLDAFTGYASWPIGYNHPGMDDPAFREELANCSLMKPANSDVYTVSLARFVETFGTHVTPEGFPHHFWISGGSLAVENAMKTAFDWKAHRLGRNSYTDNCDDLVIMHLRQAFHGRSGYTMSVTNTLPDKVGLFPKFHWPRISNPFIVFDDQGGIANDVEAEEAISLEQAREALEVEYRDRVAGILIEPMQGEGGDNHFRTEYLQQLRGLADEFDSLLLFDEVQTGFFGSGKPWLWQHHGVAPDVVAFGKKSQVCGIYASERVDEVPQNVFRKSSRINSTWGGNLVDMVRSRRMIEIIQEEDLGGRVLVTGQKLLDGLRSITASCSQLSSARGVGSLAAVTCEDAECRSRFVTGLHDRKILALPCGTRSIRFRIPLTMTDDEVDLLLQAVADVASTVVAPSGD